MVDRNDTDSNINSNLPYHSTKKYNPNYHTDVKTLAESISKCKDDSEVDTRVDMLFKSVFSEGFMGQKKVASNS